MRLCFLIAAHSLPDMFRAAVESVYDERHLYLLHVDRKSTDRALRSAAADFAERDNVRQIEDRSVSWGGFSQIAMELMALEEAIGWAHWDHFVFMSGTDLLVRSLRDLEGTLDSAGTRSFIDRREIRAMESPWRERFTRRHRWVHVELGSRIIRLPIPLRLFGKVATHYGSQWHFLHRGFCERVVSRVGRRGIPWPLRYCVIPDEAFWQNILGDDPDIDDLIISATHRYMVFKGAPNPRWLTQEDVPAIEASGALIARKFHPVISREVIAYFRDKVTKR